LHEFELLAGPVKVLEPEVATAGRTALRTTTAVTPATWSSRHHELVPLVMSITRSLALG